MEGKRTASNKKISYIAKSVNIPIELYESMRGKYFMGYADNLILGNGTGAWARLYNPVNSGVNLYVNVWTVTDLSESLFLAEFWFNSDAYGKWTNLDTVTTTNFTLYPTPEPRIRLQAASCVLSEPPSGTKGFIRNGQPGTTVVDTENGKLIFPPGGSFMAYMSLRDDKSSYATGRIAFGWWEEKIRC
ncbi:MAG: DUF6143 family protein [Eubacteriales bacterium]